ncbi:T9SS type A sorting domain-containing protein [Hymenobacter negativus]|uniref:T9SS type A sorting domain-containing protein n=1 Tax=Hymenobacter negativus TaxID=2795026 RepID=A0ABS3QAH6_9BACT|nr:T9SS type A sorting domain-containing protein [Hymenobacter negativus]MBO2008237.1 T9SS type A sorting domain-containing protein [Hymenobacter negativus]
MVPTFTRFFSFILALSAAFCLCTGGALAQAPAWQWGLQTTNPSPTDNSSAKGTAVATDAAGRVYISGLQEPGITGGNGAPVRSFGNIGSTVAGRTGFVAQATAAGQWAWMMPVVATGANSSNGYYTQVTGIAATATGDVYATGTVFGTSILVGGQVQSLTTTSLPVWGMFVVRLNSAGICQWVQTTAVSSGGLNTSAVALDPSTGGVVVAGSYVGTPTFGTTALPASSGATGGAVFVARLNAAGQWQGAAASGGTTGALTAVTVAVGNAGQVAVATSQRAGDITFGTTTLTAPAGTDQSYVVAQLSPANQWDWAVGSGASSTSSWTIGAAYTASGALWVSGRGANGTALGTTTLVAPTGGGPTSFAGFVGQLSANGQWGVVRQFSPASSGLAVAGPLAVDAAGNAVTLGGLVGFTGSVQATLGSQPLASTGTDLLLFVATLNTAGQWRYVAPVPQPTLSSGLSPTAISLDANNGLYMTGTFRGGLTLGNTTLTGSYAPTVTYPNYGDAVLAKLANATTLATRTSTAEAALTCSPNPAHGQATVQLLTVAAPTTATISDAAGRVIRTYAIAACATSATLDLTGLAPGLYVVRCGAASGRLVVE